MTEPTRRHPHHLWSDLFRKNKSERTPIIEVLRSNILFQTLSPRELDYLATLLYERVFQPEETIFEQNDRGIGMYIIAKGRVTIKNMGGQNETLVTTLGDGSFFGELSLVDPNNIRSATAIATERTTLIGFFMPDLTEVMERKPEMGVKILFQLCTVIGRRLTETTERISLFSRARGITEIHDDII